MVTSFDASIEEISIHRVGNKIQNEFYSLSEQPLKIFHIYIHGNKNLIEKGFDEEKSMNFYKVYFKEEQ